MLRSIGFGTECGSPSVTPDTTNTTFPNPSRFPLGPYWAACVMPHRFGDFLSVSTWL